MRLLLPGALDRSAGSDRGREALPHILDALARVQDTSATSLGEDILQAAPHLPAPSAA